MKLKILLTGKNGQLGHELHTQLGRLGQLIALGREKLNLGDPDAIRRTIHEVHPHLIVNAAAYTAVDEAESDSASAQTVNSAAPAVIAAEARKIGAAIVHYSTDYVFDGNKRTPYEEVDQPNPLNIYGETKLAGEQAVQRAGVPYLILRTSWVYATRGKNFLLTILRLATEREELRIVEDQVGAPTWSRMIALGTLHILTQLNAAPSGLTRLKESSGVYHLTAGGQTNWYEFARAVLKDCSNSSTLGSWFRQATGGKQLRVRRIFPISTSQHLTSAWRPAYSLLSNNKVLRTFHLQLPSWRTQLHLAVRDTPPEELQRLLR